MENHIVLSLVFIFAVSIHQSQGEDHDSQAVDIIGHCDFDGLKFYNNECQKFVQCAKPFLYLMVCSEGSYFSQRDQKCSYISELGCVEEQSDYPITSVKPSTSTTLKSTSTTTTVTTTPTTTTTTTTTTTPTTTTTTTTTITTPEPISTWPTTTTASKCREGCYPDICESDFDAWPADDLTCDYFYECYDNCTCLKQCDEGLWYDEDVGFCNFIPMVSSCTNNVGESAIGLKLDHATILKDRSSMMSPMCSKGTVENCATHGFHEVWNEDLSTLLIQSCSHGWNCLLRCETGYGFDPKSEQCVKNH